MIPHDDSPTIPFCPGDDIAAGERLASAERRLAAVDQAARLFRRRWDQVSDWLRYTLTHWHDDAEAVRGLRALGKLLACALNDAPRRLAECDWPAPYWPHAREVLLAACRQRAGERANAHRSRIGVL